MSFVKINQELCRQDGICSQECPLQLISLNGGSKFPEAIDGAESRCVKCGHCVSVCPHNAISIEGIEKCEPIVEENFASDAQIAQLIKFRRSIRSFKSKKVEKEILEKLLDTARYAPTGGNGQQVNWLVINSPEIVRQLAEKVIEFFRKMAESSSAIGEKYNLESVIKRWDSGYDIILRGAPALVMVHSPAKYGLSTVDNTIALSYFDLAATNMGMGTCWAGFLMIAISQSPEILKSLNLPEGNIITGALMLGYPKYKFHRIPPRKEAQVIWRE